MRIVVATALVRDGRVLVAQRAEPPELAGRWELPGGSVEPGESEPAAVARECREELGADVTATARLGDAIPISIGAIHVWLADPVRDGPEPAALEHTALRWLGPDELDDVDWLDTDRVVLPALAAHLRGLG